ncbi:MAG: hypothetical protein MJ090_03260 [Clostridia bacterium]|nr:hypothetical protein [Clostridia bacterium]
MKITGMFPTIVCKDADSLIQFASEKFGFHIAHAPQAIISKKQSDCANIMKNEAGVRFDIISFDIDTPICGMCINVDDFDEAFSVFKEDGYISAGEPVVVDSAKKVLLKKVENIPILLIEHYK